MMHSLDSGLQDAEPAQAADFEPFVRLGLPWRPNPDAETNPASSRSRLQSPKPIQARKVKKFQATEPEQEGEVKVSKNYLLRLTRDKQVTILSKLYSITPLAAGPRNL